MARVSVFLWRAYRISFREMVMAPYTFSDDNLVCCHFYLFDLVKIGIYECYDDKTDTGVQSHCKSYAGLSFYQPADGRSGGCQQDERHEPGGA